MLTTRVSAHTCGADWSGWLDDTHPTVEDGKVKRKVCFRDLSNGYKNAIRISVKNCGSYFIYKLYLTYLLLTLLWYRLNVKQKIQEIRELIN